MNTKAVPAHITAMHKGARAFAVRNRVILSPVAAKPAKLKMFLPKRISLANIDPFRHLVRVPPSAMKLLVGVRHRSRCTARLAARRAPNVSTALHRAPES